MSKPATLVRFWYYRNGSAQQLHQDMPVRDFDDFIKKWRDFMTKNGARPANNHVEVMYNVPLAELLTADQQHAAVVDHALGAHR